MQNGSRRGIISLLNADTIQQICVHSFMVVSSGIVGLFSHLYKIDSINMYIYMCIKTKSED